MHEFSAGMEFEGANYYREKLVTLERFQSKTLVVIDDLTDIDVMSITSSDEYAYVNYMKIKEGSIIYAKSLEVKKKLDETDEEIISTVSQELRAQAASSNVIILSNVAITLLPDGVENILPKIGDKKKLVMLSLKNALELKKEKTILREGKKSKQNEVLEILKKDMHLEKIPFVIECFDNSNFQGTSPVASMVRFTNGKPDKKNYRHFNIKTVEGPNDFASMKEIVTRRYKRLIEENQPLPDLIIVDGGKGQLSSACEALKEIGVYGKVPIAGIAKRLEEIYYPEDPLPLLINKKSPGLMLLQHLRDEAHRFAITFHRLKRSKKLINSELEELEGIGRGTVETLLKHFKSAKKIKEATVEQITEIIGPKKAAIIMSLNKKGGE